MAFHEFFKMCSSKLTCLKVSLLRAADHWRTVAIPNKGIANIKTSDGPNGARGAVFKAGTRVRMDIYIWSRRIRAD